MSDRPFLLSRLWRAIPTDAPRLLREVCAEAGVSRGYALRRVRPWALTGHVETSGAGRTLSVVRLDASSRVPSVSWDGCITYVTGVSGQWRIVDRRGGAPEISHYRATCPATPPGGRA